MTLKKHFLSFLFFITAVLSANAQASADDARTWAEEWSRAFSAEGRRQWTPEFTVRLYTGFVTSGPAVTAGVRVDGKRTLGLMVWQGDTYIDADPADVYSLSAGLYFRRYFPLGRRNIVSLYSDVALGAGRVYKVSGGRINDPRTDLSELPVDYSEGDILFAATWQPGLRLRIWKNLQLFFGPTLSTDTVGLHLGVGF